MKDVTVYVIPQLFKFEDAAKILGFEGSRFKFLKEFVYKERGLQFTKINRKISISSFELVRYMLENNLADPATVLGKLELASR